MKLYTPENLVRINYARMAAMVAAVIICGYLILSSALSFREIWNAERDFRRGKAELSKLTLDASQKRSQDARQKQPSNGGVEQFALAFSQWALARDVHIESLVPEGSPSPAEVSLGSVKLGTWNSSQIRVRGNGQYPQLMSLFDQLRDPGLPVQIQSFSLESTEAGNNSPVSFEIVLMVYEKKGGTS